MSREAYSNYRFKAGGASAIGPAAAEQRKRNGVSARKLRRVKAAKVRRSAGKDKLS